MWRHLILLSVFPAIRKFYEFVLQTYDSVALLLAWNIVRKLHLMDPWFCYYCMRKYDMMHVIATRYRWWSPACYVPWRDVHIKLREHRVTKSVLYKCYETLSWCPQDTKATSWLRRLLVRCPSLVALILQKCSLVSSALSITHTSTCSPATLGGRVGQLVTPILATSNVWLRSSRWASSITSISREEVG